MCYFLSAFLKSLCYNQNKMGPGINNSTNSIGNYKFSEQQLNVPLNNLASKRDKNKKMIFIGVAALFFVLFIILILKIFISPKKVGSGDIKDYIAFVKLYQYGDENEKKDVNANLPANYTYAYKMLSESATSEEKSNYASKLNERYLKYSNQEPIASFLTLFNNYLEIGEKVTKIRAAYVQDSQVAKTLANKYASQIKTSEISYAKERLDYFTTYYSKYIDYLDQVKNAGCVKGNSIDVNCEVNSRINPDNEALNALYTELDGIERIFYDSYLDSTLYLNNSIIALYNTKSTTKENKR